jgi:hypothetical protein
MSQEKPAQTEPPKMKMTTDIPAEITTPDSVETRLGTLRFFDGVPDQATVETCYDNLDFQRGVQAFLVALPAAGMYAAREGLGSFGPANQTVVVFESLVDSRSLLPTSNTETIYTLFWLDTKGGPLVVELPPNLLGMMNDFWQRWVIDLGRAGPDKGAGGKYLVLPPGYTGEVPEGYFVARSPTFGNIFFFRGFMVNGDAKPAVDAIKRQTRVYPLSQAAEPPDMKFVDGSGKAFSTILSSSFAFFEEVNQVVQEEPVDATDPETLGLLASIGIQKGKPFAPDARMKNILSEAAAVGNATVRALVFKAREPRYYLYPESAWVNPFISSYQFLNEGVRDLDARSFYYFYALTISPAMSIKMVGAGSQYAGAFMDADGNPFDGGKTYKLHLPPNIPAKDFWSLLLYDNQTRSMLQTDERFPSISSQKKGIVVNSDTSVDVYFGPEAPTGKESNWVQTIPGKGWNIILRLYGPLEPWFDKTWKPGEIEEVK